MRTRLIGKGAERTLTLVPRPQVSNRVLDLYATVMGQSDEVDMRLQQLREKVSPTAAAVV